MKSMTGYAKVQCDLGIKKLNIEIKTLNSKQLDIITKIPAAYRSRELEMRQLLNKLERGKVELTISEEGATSNTSLNRELLSERYLAAKAAADAIQADSSQIFSILLLSNDIWNTDNHDTDEDEWTKLQSSLDQAIAQTDSFRSHEGNILEKDFKIHVDQIDTLLQKIPPYEAERIETAKERIKKYMADADIKELDANRFEQELIYYLEKLDITEEKVRLKKHIDYFRQTMAEEPSCGKKLGFIAQEMGREINTTGSKANHVEIQRIVVAMKDELEKIKEQLGNVL